MTYTAAQIVTLACQICNSPGRTAQAGQLLNMILANYAQTEDLDIIRLTTSLTIGPQATIPYFYALPSNYLRFYDVFYQVNGEPFYLSEIPLSDLDQLYTGEGVDNFPNTFATDMSQTPQPTAGTSPSMAFYPPPATPLVVTVRYRPQTSDIATPETSSTVPWFANQLILLKELCMQLGDVVGDDRSPRWEQEVEKKMRKYLIMDDDKGGYSQTVKLDRRQFRNAGNLPPSKKLGF